MNKLLETYRSNIWLKLFWWLAVIIPGIPFIIFSVGFQLYAHWPRDFSQITSITVNPKTEYLSLSVHGVKDNPKSWSNRLQNTIKNTNVQQLAKFQKAQVSLSWQPYSDNALVCSVTGRNIGEQLANKVAKLPNIKVIHLIGHSCGSFVIYGLCEKLKQIKPMIRVQSTYLDPVAIYSGLFWQYGVNNFGSCADFSDSYIDTQDTVPGSNQNLKHAYTFDVTDIRLKNKHPYAPHAWPTFFYIDAYKNNQIPILSDEDIELSDKLNNDKLTKW